MAKLLKNVLLISFVLFFYVVIVSAEEITITTYYPSPYGSYRALSADTLGVGDNDVDGLINSDDVPTLTGNVWIAGNVGLGTILPRGKLDVKGQALLADTQNNAVLVAPNNGNVGFAFRTATNIATYTGVADFVDRVVIAPGTGNVGIGQANPQQRLVVNGTAEMQGFKMVPNAAVDRVLTSDQFGVGSWQPLGLALNCQVVTASGGTTTDVSCPANVVMTGGGCEIIGGVGSIVTSKPLNTTTWRCRATNNLQAHAMCCGY